MADRDPSADTADPANASMLTDLLFAKAGELGDRPFLHARAEGDGDAAAWSTVTWAETKDMVLRLAGGLRRLGIEPGDRVALISENRPEWLIADHGIMAAGAVTVPAYVTHTEDDHHHLLSDCQAKAVIVSTGELARKVMPAAARSAACRHVVTMEPVELEQSLGFELHRWGELLEAEPAAPHEGARTDTACIIYTSGTGGAPKGVMLSHGAILANCEGIRHLFRNVRFGDEVFLSFLPLSHSYEHTAGQFFPLSIGAEIYYAEGSDTIARDMADVKPTFVIAVPRLYEVFQHRAMLALRRQSPFRRTLFERAVAIGRKRRADGQRLTLWERLQDVVLEVLVRRKVRERFGGRLRFMVSGGAPLNPEVGAFFLALGIETLQGYGQTESAPVVSCNPPERIKIESVGPPLKNVECRIAEDGELLVRGELVMQGYWENPEATAETLSDGWLHTGDVAEFDEDGYLRITDRKKDIIVNSGGDNLSPQRVEGFLTLEPEIAQAMVYGDRKPHLVAVIVPADGLAEDDDTAKRQRIGVAVDRVNKALSSIERVRRFVIADAPFSVENGQLTPTLKVRRHAVTEAYGERLEALYH